MKHQICTNCVMDTSDRNISFDSGGVCNHCALHRSELKKIFRGPGLISPALAGIVENIRKKAGRSKYDCVIGLSGGVDSSYTAFLVKELGLKPLAVHLDNGWNSDIAVRNIKRIVSRLDIDLYTHVINWNEFKDIQRAFLIASVPDAEIPSDHAITSCLLNIARKFNIKTIITGSNPHTESHLPVSWSQGHWDYGYIKSVHRAHGSGKVKTYPHMNFEKFILWKLGRLPLFSVLEYVNFDKEAAQKTIEDQLGWESYGGKHHENIFTRWYQGHYLPVKFGFDKRKTHFSSLVSSAKLSREVALQKLQAPPYDEHLQRQDTDYVAKKLGFEPADFNGIMSAQPNFFESYASYERIFNSEPINVVRRLRRSTQNWLNKPLTKT